MLEPYTIMARHYDNVLKYVDYNEWYYYLLTIIDRFVPHTKKILEIGTGTGKFGAKFSADQFEIYGMDKSYQMLSMAQKRAYHNFHIFCADVTNFYLKEKFDFIFSVHDTFNYLLTGEALAQAFANIHDIMHNGTIFLFDITTEFNIKRHFHQKFEKFYSKGVEILWSNTYDPAKRCIYSTLTFVKKDRSSSSETHIQKIHTVAEITELLNQAGFQVMAIYGDYTFKTYSDSTIMINFITRKKK
jgi:SAM-dependent methyltransferase